MPQEWHIGMSADPAARSSIGPTAPHCKHIVLVAEAAERRSAPPSAFMSPLCTITCSRRADATLWNSPPNCGSTGCPAANNFSHNPRIVARIAGSFSPGRPNTHTSDGRGDHSRLCESLCISRTFVING